MWTQIVGKIRLARAVDQSFLARHALSHGPRPDHFADSASRWNFQIDFDFVDHVLRIEKSDGRGENNRAGAEIRRRLLWRGDECAGELDLPVEINTTPNEFDPRFHSNRTTNTAYDPEYANRFWRVLLQSDRVFKEFRAGFCGKCSPVHFFWGSFDLAVTRFSGRARRRIPAAFRICPTPSRAKPTRMK